MNKGTHIIAGSVSGRIYIWNSQSGRLIVDSPAHFEAITHISLSLDDTLILTASTEGNAKLWSAADLIEACENSLVDDPTAMLKTEAE